MQLEFRAVHSHKEKHQVSKMTQNKVELIGYYGGDRRSCISAWQSTTEELGIELPDSIPDRVDAIFEAIAKTKKKSPWELLDFLASEGHHCYDDQTEILTSNGWKFFKDLVEDDLVCAVNIKTRTCHFEKPQQIYHSHYDEPMYYVKGQQVDLAVTKGHRMVVSQKRKANGSDYGTEWEFQTPEQINGNSRKYLKSAQILNKNFFPEQNFAKLLGFFIGDGSYGSLNTAHFHLKKKRKIEYLYSLGFDVHANLKNNTYHVQLPEGLGKWLKDSCYSSDGAKKLPDEYLQFSKEDVLSIVEGLENSDGTKKHSKWEYLTTSEILADQLVTLSCLHNFVFTKSRNTYINDWTGNPYTLYRLAFSSRVAPEISTMKSRPLGTQYWEKYTGVVSCVTVTTGAIMVRRNGHTCVSGNTPFEKGILDFQITGDIASHIHALKHRISQINSESARYKEFVADRFYIPEDWSGLTLQENFLEDNGEIAYKSGQYWSDILKHESERHFKLYHQAIKDISKPLGRKRAKESARYFLGYNTQLNFDWQMNFRSFVNIQKLRNSPHAQCEIKSIANTMLYLVENIPDKPFQYTLKAFGLKSTVEDNLFL